jgi:penicillin amidase
VHRIPFVGRYFDIVATPLSGSGTTVKQTTMKLAPSMRMTADLGDWSRSLMNVQIGQSGHILSRHYRDQWLDWYYARTVPMQWKAEGAGLKFERKK